MNFKDIYSRANEELHGDTKILEELLKTERTKKRRFVPYIMPAVAAAAAAAIMLLNPAVTDDGLQNGNPYSNHTQIVSGVSVGGESYAAETEYQNDPHSTQIQHFREGEKPQSGDKLRQNEYCDASGITPSGMLVSDHKATLRNVTDAENGGTSQGIARISDEIPTADTVLYINRVERLGGAAPSPAAVSAERRRVMTNGEYAAYIGVDIASAAILPGDMVMESPGFVTAEVDGENDRILKERGVYLAHSENFQRFAEITVSRTENIVIPEKGLKKSEVNGNSVLVLSDGTDFSASFTKNDVQYLIKTGGIRQEELTELLKSLNGGIENEEKSNGGGADSADDDDIRSGTGIGGGQ